MSLVDTDPDLCALATDLPGVRVFCGDATEAATLKRAGVEDAKCFVAATPSDKVNLLVCQVARSAFDVPRLVARANAAATVAAFKAVGIEVMSPANAAATILENMILRPNLFGLLSAGPHSDHVAEVEVTAPGGAGKTLAALALEGCVVVVVRRGNSLIAPQGATELRMGDVLTILGTEGAVSRARERLRNGD